VAFGKHSANCNFAGFVEEIHLTNMPQLGEPDMAQSVQLDLQLK
jgi:hypothetical protein